MRELTVGMIGLGRMGQNHLRILSMLRGVKIGFVFDQDKKRLAAFAKQYNVPGVDDLPSALARVDAVVIATPTVSHFELFNLASQHVQFLFIEKPLTDHFETSKKIRDVAIERDLKIQVGFIERFNPALIVLKESVLRDQEVVNIDFVRTNKLSQRIKDVDVVSDLMTHDLDLALFLNGPIQSCSAYGTASNGTIEYARANLRHESGAFSNITASRITEKRRRQVSVTCRGLFVDCNLLRKEVALSVQTEEKYIDDLAITSTENIIDVKQQEPLLNELSAFVGMCHSDGKEGYTREYFEDAVSSIFWAEEVRKAILA